MNKDCLILKSAGLNDSSSVTERVKGIEDVPWSHRLEPGAQVSKSDAYFYRAVARKD